MDWQSGINNAIDYMEDNLLENIDYSKVAAFMGCSSWKFQRIFSFLINMSPGEYIRKRRLTQAADEIKSGNCQIIDIALKYGYNSHASFSRAFTKAFGISPSSLRINENTKLFPKINFEYIERERLVKKSKFSERGYVVRENGAIYYTKDLKKTVEWFENVLEWYGDIVENNDNADYGCVYDYPTDVAMAHLTTFRGFHLFKGTPSKGVVGFLMVDNLDGLCNYVKSQGWTKISDIEDKPWNARECSITTVDGSILLFFETKDNK